MSQREDDLIRHVETPLPERGPVFCEACRYFDQGAQADCTHENARVQIRTWQREETASIPASVRNAHNDCSDFRAVTLGRALAREAGIDCSNAIRWMALVALLAVAFCAIISASFTLMSILH